MSHIKDHDSLHQCRTEIPNIIFTLGLDPYELALYIYFKRVAGDRGHCFKSTETMSKEINICKRKIVDLKKELSKPRKELNGKSLIKIEKRTTEKGDSDTDLITINCIWEDNFKLFLGVVHNMHRGGAQDAGGVVHDMHKGGAQDAYKEDLIEEDHLEEYKKGANKSPMPSADAEALCDFFISKMKEKKPDIKVYRERWLLDVDRMLRLDGRSKEIIQRLIEWTQTDEKWWRANLLSMESLRKNYDKIELAMKAEEKKNWARKNREWAIGLKQTYHKELKEMSYDDWGVRFIKSAKDLSWNMEPSAFQEHFKHIFRSENV